MPGHVPRRPRAHPPGARNKNALPPASWVSGQPRGQGESVPDLPAARLVPPTSAQAQKTGRPALTSLVFKYSQGCGDSVPTPPHATRDRQGALALPDTVSLPVPSALMGRACPCAPPRHRDATVTPPPVPSVAATSAGIPPGLVDDGAHEPYPGPARGGLPAIADPAPAASPLRFDGGFSMSTMASQESRKRRAIPVSHLLQGRPEGISLGLNMRNEIPHCGRNLWN